MASKALLPALKAAWGFLLEEGKKVPAEARFAITNAGLTGAIAALASVEGDLNSKEKEGLDDIISKFKLTCSIAGCNTEKEASGQIITAMGRASLSTEERRQVMQAIYRVLDDD
jgi:hypothetical protein